MTNSKLISLILFALVIVLLLSSTILAVGMQKYYKAYLNRGLHPLGSDSKHLAVIIPEGKRSIVIVGDSRAQHWNTQGDFWRKWEIFNLGHSGSTSAQTNLIQEKIEVEGIANVVLICVGINDLKALYFFENTKQQITNALVGNIKILANKHALAGSDIIICNVFPEGRNGGIRRLVWASDMQQIIESVNQDLFSVCQQNNYQYLDAYSIVMAGKKSTPAKSEYYKDFLHLNDNGYAVLNDELEKLID